MAMRSCMIRLYTCRPSASQPIISCTDPKLIDGLRHLRLAEDPVRYDLFGQQVKRASHQANIVGVIMEREPQPRAMESVPVVSPTTSTEHMTVAIPTSSNPSPQGENNFML